MEGESNDTDIFCVHCNYVLDIIRSVSTNGLDMGEQDVLSQDTNDIIHDKNNDENDQENEDNDDEDDDEDENEDDDDDDNDEEKKNKATEKEKKEKNKTNVDYQKILKKAESGEQLSSEELLSIDIKEIFKHDYYKKIPKKGELKKKIIDMIEDLGNSDENKKAYFICNNCGYHRAIQPQLKVLSKMREGIAVDDNDVVNETYYRNKVFMKTLPNTREFKCINNKCPSVIGKVSPEAKFIRKNANTYELVYVCTRCLTIKMN
jgi:hypothetical protein